ncbi:MAG: hypothetical protein CMD23_03895 [Flavobacteriales bacterium]|nr:hypothetical protein [Flavobacteriales bacterium]|tara:strand:- start:1549 stop:1761 length:213 start_codon:yes stop_codon:yes gene_type:complete
MKNIYQKIKDIITQALDIAVPFLCLALVTQVMVGGKLGSWDPVGNLKSFGAETIIGIAAILILYHYIQKK